MCLIFKVNILQDLNNDTSHFILTQNDKCIYLKRILDILKQKERLGVIHMKLVMV